MTRALPFTECSLARAIKGVEKAGRFVVGFNLADCTLIVADKPVDVTSLVPVEAQKSRSDKSSWDDV